MITIVGDKVMPKNLEAATPAYTMDSLRAELKEKGWSFAKALKDTGVSWYAWIRMPGDVEPSPDGQNSQLVLTPYSFESADRAFHSVQFDIRGELANNRPLQAMVYSIDLDEAIEHIEPCTAILRAAWNAALTESKKFPRK